MKINELKESCIAVENVYLDKEAVKTELTDFIMRSLEQKTC